MLIRKSHKKPRDFRRTPMTVDIFNPTTEAKKTLFKQNRLDAVKHFYLGMTESAKLLKKIGVTITSQLIPRAR